MESTPSEWTRSELQWSADSSRTRPNTRRGRASPTPTESHTAHTHRRESTLRPLSTRTRSKCGSGRVRVPARSAYLGSLGNKTSAEVQIPAKKVKLLDPNFWETCRQWRHAVKFQPSWVSRDVCPCKAAGQRCHPAASTALRRDVVFGEVCMETRGGKKINKCTNKSKQECRFFISSCSTLQACWHNERLWCWRPVPCLRCQHADKNCGGGKKFIGAYKT